MKASSILLSILLLASLWSCSPKAVPVEVPVVEETPQEVEPVERLTPCVTFDDLSVSDRDLAETSYVLYRDFMRANDMTTAASHWRKAYLLAPGSNGRVKYQYDDGVKIYEYLITKTTDTSLRKSYVDTIMMVFDKRVGCFGEAGYVAGRKAFDYYYKHSAYTTTERILELFKQAVDAKGPKADYFVVNPFTAILYEGVTGGSISNEEARPYAKHLSTAIIDGLSNCEGKRCETWKIIDDYATVRLEALEGIDGFYDCEYYIDKYYAQYLDDSTNCEVINKAYRRILRGACDSTMQEVRAIAEAKANRCYTPPPPPGLLRQGYDCYTNGDYTCAIERFEQYIDKTDDVEKKAKYYLTIAKIYYGDIKNFPQSRKYARMAADLKPDWGEPYILIGKLYASSGPLCGPGTGWESQVVTWVAIDQFAYAKKIDPSVRAEANKWINQYKQYMPSKADLFQRTDINAGDRYLVPCWINEYTTVRAAP